MWTGPWPPFPVIKMFISLSTRSLKMWKTYRNRTSYKRERQHKGWEGGLGSKDAGLPGCEGTLVALHVSASTAPTAMIWRENTLKSISRKLCIMSKKTRNFHNEEFISFDKNLISMESQNPPVHNAWIHSVMWFRGGPDLEANFAPI